MNAPLYRQYARTLNALSNCIKSNNHEWEDRHTASLEALDDFMPSGSGVDCGTKLDIDASLRQADRLVFTFSFHHMDDAGGYDGWTDHKAVVSPSLVYDFDLKITGRDRNGIKEYLHELFHAALSDVIEHNADGFVSLSRQAAVAAFKADVAAGKVV